MKECTVSHGISKTLEITRALLFRIVQVVVSWFYFEISKEKY